MALPKWIGAAHRRFRGRRMADFAAALRVTPRTRVLDVGGTAWIWESLSVRPRVTLVNMPRAGEKPAAGFTPVFADGCALPFRDRSFDIVFSNSVIEHVGETGRQRAFAREIERVGRAYWVQTPNRYFWLEPHVLTPFIHFLPVRWRANVARRFTFWQWLARPTPDEKAYMLRHFAEEIRLLGPGEMRALFPAAELRKERWLGWTKSLIAVRRG